MAYLEIVSPEEKKGQRFDITKGEITIGRVQDNDVTVEDVAASSHHCKVIHKEDQYIIRDLGSTNGTLLNGMEVAQSHLNPGDMITVGSIEMKIDGDDMQTDEDRSIQSDRGASANNTVVLDRSRGAPSVFETKRNTRGIWIAIGVLVAALVAALLYWFVTVLFAG